MCASASVRMKENERWERERVCVCGGGGGRRVQDQFIIMMNVKSYKLIFNIYFTLRIKQRLCKKKKNVCKDSRLQF